MNTINYLLISFFYLFFTSNIVIAKCTQMPTTGTATIITDVIAGFGWTSTSSVIVHNLEIVSTGDTLTDAMNFESVAEPTVGTSYDFYVQDHCTGSASLMISAIDDGPLTSGVLKEIELHPIDEVSNLGDYGIGSAINGGGSTGEKFTFSTNAADHFIFTTNYAPPSITNCGAYSSSPTKIIDNLNDPMDTISVAGTGPEVLSDLNIIFAIDHTYLGDLDIILTSPVGTVVNLMLNLCNSNDNINVEFDDESTNALVCAAPTVGTFTTPSGNLADFYGETFDGDWILSVSDDFSGDDGILLQWCLVPTLVPPPLCMITELTTGTQTSCDPETNIYTQDVTVTYTDAPATGSLNVNGQLFPIGISPQTVTLTGLTADGLDVDVDAFFDAEILCPLDSVALFTSPANCTPPPTNDDCMMAEVLTQENSVSCITPVPGDIAAATNSGITTCAELIAKDDVWYSFVAMSPNVTIEIDDDFDGILELFEGSCGALTSIECSDPGIINTTGLTVGTTYYVRVWDYYVVPPPITTFTICVFGVIPNCTFPMVTATESCVDNENFEVVIDLTTLGSSATYTIQDNQTSTPITGIAATGIYNIGPYPNGTVVEVTITSDDDPLCNIVYSGLELNCAPPPTTNCGAYSRSPAKIINDLNERKDTISVAGTGPEVLSDLNIIFAIDHTYLEDLDVTLTSPVGTVVNLILNLCNSNNNINVEFDDESTNALACATPTIGTFTTPSGNLSDFYGETFDGDWVLSVSDDFSGDNGILLQWCLVPTLVPPPLCMITELTAGTQTSCDPETNIYTQDVTVTFTDAPATGSLNVNEQLFPIGISPQTVTLTGLTADGLDVDVDAFFDAEILCPLDSVALFTSPANCTPPPTNDDCMMAEVLTQENSVTCITPISGDNAGATDSGINACSGPNANDDVWYSFVAMSSNVTIEIDDDFDGVVELFEGSCGTLTSIGCSYPSTINATELTVGTTYYARVWYYYAVPPPTTTFTICVYGTIPNCTFPVATATESCVDNDNFEVVIDLTTLGSSATYTIQDNQTSTSITGIVATGIYNIGPYPNETVVEVTLASVDDPLCNIVYTGLELNCEPPPTTTCGAYSSSPAKIIDDLNDPIDTISVTGTGPEVLIDLNIIFAIDHTYLEDLDVTLTSPTGTVVNVMLDQCLGNDNINVEFDDESTNALACATPTIGTFTTPSGNLSDFYGETFDGDWMLSVSDDFSPDNGILLQWCLVPTLVPPPLCMITELTAGTQTSCDPGTNTYAQDVTVTFTGAPATGSLNVNGQLFLIGVSPQTVTLTGLTADELDVDVNAFFDAEILCPLDSVALFTSPANCTPPPTNDDCMMAEVLTQENSVTCITPVPGDIVTATDSGIAACTGLNANDDVWYSFVAMSPNVTIEIDDDFDGVLELFEGSCGALTSIGCSDPGIINAVELTVGTTYYTRVWYYFAESPVTTTFTICVYGAIPNCTFPSVSVAESCVDNDNFEVVIDLTTLGSSATYTIQDNQTSTPITGIVATGIYNIGPYPNETVVEVTIASDDPLCNIVYSGLELNCAPPPTTTCGAYSSSPAKTINFFNDLKDTISVAGTGPEVLSDLNIIFAIDHTYLEDLNVTLTSPVGTVVDVMLDQCLGNDNINVEFDDESTNALACATPTVGTFTTPSGNLADFYGETFDGDWILSVSDDFNEDDGILLQWCLEPILGCMITELTTGTQTSCDSGTNTYTQDVTITFIGAPATGSLDVNGQLFPIGVSPQTVTLTGLTADGLDVDVNAFFDAEIMCSLDSVALFTSPINCIPPPANDDCMMAEVLTQENSTTCINPVAGDITGATDSGIVACVGSNADDDVWYSFVAMSPELTVRINEHFDGVVELFEGSCGALTSIGCSDPGIINAVGLTVGNIYYARVWNYYEGPSEITPFSICVYGVIPNCTFPSVSVAENCIDNDNFEVVVNLTSIGSSTTYTIQDNQSTTPITGITTAGMYNIGTYSNGTIVEVTVVSDDDAACNIVYSGLEEDCTPPPPNDLCAVAATLPVQLGSCVTYSVGNNIAANDSGELPAPSCGGYSGGDIWFEVIVPTSGNIIIDHGVNVFSTVGGSLYSGVCGALTEVDCEVYDWPMTLTGLTPGTHYLRIWDFFNNDFGDVEICAFEPASCTITAITAEAQPVCDSVNNSYTQEVIVTYEIGAGLIGVLNVNGESFAITASPQTVTLIGLVSDGAAVDVTAVFSNDVACTFTEVDLFTAPAACVTFPTDNCGAYSSSPGLAIDEANDPSDIITVTGTGPNYLSDLNIILSIDHTYLGDLDITLTSPSGTVVDVMFDLCGANSNINVEFDDEAGNPLACSSSTIGTFTTPSGNLADFYGETFVGDWTLSIVDDSFGDGGILNQWCLVPTFTAPNIVLDAKFILGGPYNTGTGMMSDDLRSMALIPTAEPYTGLGFTHSGSGGGETAMTTVFDVTGADAIIDWVFVELRDLNDATIIRGTRSAFVQADGDLIDVDGVSLVSFSGLTASNYHVAIRHRNHLGVMSDVPIALSATPNPQLDFSLGNAFGDDAQKVFSGGENVFYGGDLNASGIIDAADRSIAWNTKNQFGYLQQDSDLNGVCDSADRSLAWNNRNKFSKIP